MSWFDCNHQLIAKHQCWSIYCILYLHIYYTYNSSFWWFHKLVDGWENLSMEISSIANLQLSGSIHESFQAEVWVEWTSQIIMLTRGLLFRYCRWIDLLPSENCDGFIFPPPEKTGPNLPSSKLGFQMDSKVSWTSKIGVFFLALKRHKIVHSPFWSFSVHFFV